jgi:hypothetical protein
MTTNADRIAELREELRLLGRETAPRPATAVAHPDPAGLMVEADYARDRADYDA